jgi:predicted nucleic acid-binding protein
MIAVLDSSIFIDYLNGVAQAQREISQYRHASIRPITWVEAQLKAPEGLEEATRQAIDANFTRLELTDAILFESLSLSRSHHLKLPDAMIWACALGNGWPLVTRNTKDFPASWAGVRVLYTL